MTAETMTFRRLTPEQWEQWETDGYIILKNVLSPDEVARLEAAIDRVDRQSQAQGRDPNAYLSKNGIINEDDEFLDMIDHPGHLGLAMELMGAHIQLIACQMMVRSPTPELGTRWHPDGALPYQFPRSRGLMPLLQLKVGWFVSDCDRPNMGNFVVLPGSHVNNFPAGSLEALFGGSPPDFGGPLASTVDVPGARQILVNAGDGLLFHNSLWHSVAPNLSQVRRTNLYYVYAPLYIRQHDIPSPEVIARSNLTRRQLMGAIPGPTPSYMQVNEECAPLVSLFEGKGVREVAVDQRANFLREALAWRHVRATDGR